VTYIVQGENPSLTAVVSCYWKKKGLMMACNKPQLVA